MARIPADEVRLDTIRPKPGATKNRKRVGRGPGSGLGKTSGRGHKGLGQRSGSKKRAAHEGGQNPIHMRMRKLRGPNRKMSMPFERFRTRTQPVNVGDLEARFEAGAEVTPETLKQAGLATRRYPVKILAGGELTKKLTVRVDRVSEAARKKIEAAGGTCEVLIESKPRTVKVFSPAAAPAGPVAADAPSDEPEGSSEDATATPPAEEAPAQDAAPAGEESPAPEEASEEEAPAQDAPADEAPAEGEASADEGEAPEQEAEEEVDQGQD